MQVFSIICSSAAPIDCTSNVPNVKCVQMCVVCVFLCVYRAVGALRWLAATTVTTGSASASLHKVTLSRCLHTHIQTALLACLYMHIYTNIPRTNAHTRSHQTKIVCSLQSALLADYICIIIIIIIVIIKSCNTNSHTHTKQI